MDIEKLKSILYNLEINDPIDNLDQSTYHQMLLTCAQLNEVRACIFIYDHMLSKKIKPNKLTIDILQIIHSKNIIVSDSLLTYPPDPTKLNPKRRIHKIIKGYNYSESYNNACEKNLNNIKNYLDSNKPLKEFHKNKLIPIIAHQLLIPENEVRYVITKLKRIKYL